MLTNSRKVQTGLRSNRTHEKLNKTKGHENAKRIKSISPKIKFLMQQYLNWENTGVASSSSSTHFKNTLVDEAFTVQWIAEQTGLNSHEVDKLIEREVESSVLMGHMKSKLTSKVACCLCLNGLEKLETELPQYAKFLKTARRVFASSIFEDEEADSNANGRNAKNQSFMNNKNDGRKVYDRPMYKMANYTLRDENDMLRKRIHELESQSIMNPQALITEKLSEMTKDQRKTMFSHFAETYADEYTASLSAQTNQDTLKRFYYASWNKMNNTSKEEVLHRALKTDTEVLRNAAMTKVDFLHRTFLIDNGQLLHSFLWKHMGSVVSKIIESPELLKYIVQKKVNIVVENP